MTQTNTSPTSPGIQKLQAFLAQGTVRKCVFAKDLGIKPPHLSQILSGYRPVKTLAMAAKIEAATGEVVTMRDFLDKDDRASVDNIKKSRQP